MKLALILWLVVGVPVAYGGYQLAEMANPTLVYAGLAATYGYLAFVNAPHLFQRRTHVLFYALFAFLAFATWLVKFRSDGLDYYPQLISLAVCFVWSSVFVSIFFAVRTERHLRTALGSLEVVGGLISTSVYVSFVSLVVFGVMIGEAVDRYGTQRAFGPLGDQVGFVIVLFVLSALAKGGWVRAAFHAGAILLTGTRGAYIALGVGVLWMSIDVLIRRRQRLRNRIRAVVGLAVLSALFAVILASPWGRTAAERVLSPEVRGRGVESRLGPMKLGISVALDNLALGTGYLGFSRLESQYGFARITTAGRNTYTTQNQFLQTAVDGGIPALIILVWLFVAIWRNARRVRALPPRLAEHELTAYAAYVPAILIGNQASVWLLPSASNGYFLFLVAGIVERMLRMKEMGAVPVAPTTVYGPAIPHSGDFRTSPRQAV